MFCLVCNRFVSSNTRGSKNCSVLILPVTVGCMVIMVILTDEPYLPCVCIFVECLHFFHGIK